MKYSVEWCDIKQDRLGGRLLFTRKPDKRIEFMGASMMCSGYAGLSELIDDLAVIHSIDRKEDREEV